MPAVAVAAEQASIPHCVRIVFTARSKSIEYQWSIDLFALTRRKRAYSDAGVYGTTIVGVMR